MSDHTAGPWHQGPHYRHDVESRHGRVCECGPYGAPRAIANAAFIVRACNSHEELLSALKAIVEHEQIDGTGIRYTFDWHSPLGKAARAAIAKAEGREP